MELPVQTAAAAVRKDTAHNAQNMFLPVAFSRCRKDHFGVDLVDVTSFDPQAKSGLSRFDRGFVHDPDVGIDGPGELHFQVGEFVLQQGKGFVGIDIADHHHRHVVRTVGRAPESHDIFPVTVPQVVVPAPDGVVVGAVVERHFHSPAPGDPETEGNVVVHVVFMHKHFALGVQ